MLGWNGGACKRFFSQFDKTPENFVICSPEGERPLTIADIDAWYADHPEFM